MIFLFIIFGIFLLDYNIKAYTDSHRLQGTNDEYFGGKLILRNCHNEDGAMGIFEKNPQLGRECSLIAMACTAWEFIKRLFKKGDTLGKLGLSMILGGGLSNVYDRVVKGYVTDYFSFGVKNKKLRNTVFNLSDLFILGGGVVYLLSGIVSLFHKKK